LFIRHNPDYNQPFFCSLKQHTLNNPKIDLKVSCNNIINYNILMNKV
jgi:hypothetical protein